MLTGYLDAKVVRVLAVCNFVRHSPSKLLLAVCMCPKFLHGHEACAVLTSFVTGDGRNRPIRVTQPTHPGRRNVGERVSTTLRHTQTRIAYG